MKQATVKSLLKRYPDWTYTRVAETAGCSPSYVSSIATASGIRRQTGKGQTSREAVLTALADNPDWSYGQVGAWLHCPTSWVGRVARSEDQGTKGGRHGALNVAVVAKVMDMHPDWSWPRINQAASNPSSGILIGVREVNRRSVDPTRVASMLELSPLSFEQIASQVGCDLRVVESIAASLPGITLRPTSRTTSEATESHGPVLGVA